MKRLLPLLVALAACSAKPAPKLVSPPVAVPPKVAKAMAAERAEEAAKAPAASHPLATIARRAVGPFAARGDGGELVAWIVRSANGAGQKLMVEPLGPDGAPLEPPKAVANVADEPTSLVVRPAGGRHGGWIAAWSALLDRGESLTVMGFAPDGTARTKGADVQRTSDHVKWVDLVTTPTGALCVWTEETTTGEANFLVAPVDADGKPREVPVRVARGLTGWAATSAGDGAGIALVTPSEAEAADRKTAAGSLSWLRLDRDGHPAGPPVPIGAAPTVSGDVDVVGTRGADHGPWVLAWTDRAGEEAQVMLATVDESGRVQGPERAMDTVGGSVLVGLASGAAGVALAWREPRGRARLMRAVHIAAVAEDRLGASPVTAVQAAARTPVEFAATQTGFALLSTSPQCAAPGACDGDIVPTFVRFDSSLAPVQTEPLLVGDVPGVRVASTLGWALRCAADHCSALAATGEMPTPVYSVDLPPRVPPFAAPVVRPPLPEAPRITGVSTISSGQPFADVAAARLHDATFVATLTAAVDEPDRRAKHPSGAIVSVRALGSDGQLLAPPTTVSTRAVSVGGVALAPGGSTDDGVALAWVNRDDGDPEVCLARFDRSGRRLKAFRLTHARGDASSVALAWAGDGWIVAWIDGRDGNGEVYAAKVDRALALVGHEERLTRAPGDASDVAIAVKEDLAWVAWSDPRESPRDGLADIYATTLRASNARRVGEEVRVLATAAHSRSPELAVAGDGALVVWIEDAPGEIDAPGRAMVAKLGTTGHLVAPPQRIELAGEGRPTAVALDASAEGIRAVLARTDHDEITLDAVFLPADGSGPGRPWPLLDLDAPGAFDVAVALKGNTLVFDDVGSAPDSHRVRRATVAWRR